VESTVYVYSYDELLLLVYI